MATDATVLGAGNTGFAVAANLTLAGHSVTLGELPAFPRATDRVHAALTPFFLDIVPLPDVFGCGLRAVNPVAHPPSVLLNARSIRSASAGRPSTQDDAPRTMNVEVRPFSVSSKNWRVSMRRFLRA